MGIVVSKIGGSSMADANGFRRVREIILEQERRRYIVLSAPGKRSPEDEKITDLLVRANRLCSEGKSAHRPLSIIYERFASIINELKLNVNPQIFLKSLEEDVCKSPAFAVSRGEYFCAKLFSIYAGIPFVDASELILFDKNGRIQREETDRAVCAMERRNQRAVIPGFYGSLPDKSIMTFTRGGSDITGALIAAALKADVYENWTDVDGLMSIDPKICSDAVCHCAVSYRQMRKLAQAGAQVLHPYCVEPVCETGIPTILKNTFSPEKPGTYISDSFRGMVPCVCEQKGFYAVCMDSLSAESKRIVDGFEREIYLGRHGEHIIALKNSGAKLGVSVSIVSVFGLLSGLVEEIMRYIRPIAVYHTERYSRFLIDAEQSVDAQRKIHALITMGFMESRSPSGCDA